MELTKQEFDELVAKAGTDSLSSEEAAKLEPHRARNAIILVAGTCRRCAPISFDYPKPLIEVRGEVLIERLIRQLRSAGVADITLVVGHMKEKFDYLVDKYGVTFVDSPEYAITNNIVSLAHAADRLGNTYILYGDQYYTVNPFERYVYRSFYATTLTVSDDTWVMETGPEGAVTDMVMSADGGEKLQGPCYVDAETGTALAAALVETIADKSMCDKTWEYAWYLHRDTVNISTRYYPAGVVNSFKSMDDLKAFDDAYLLHVDSPSLDNICGYLNCEPDELYDFEALLGGLTNYNVAFRVGDKHYVYRHPVGYAPVALDRKVEAIANAAARDAGVDPSFIYEDPETGWKLCYFIEGARQLDFMVEDEAKVASRLIKQFQDATKGITVEADYDRWAYALDYERQINERNYPIDELTMSYRARIEKLAGYVAADNFPKVLSHNDAWFANFLWGEDGTLYMIDWEFAAMADYLSDLANHVESYYLVVPPENRDFMRENLAIYLGREGTPEEWRHFIALIMIRCWWMCVYTINFMGASDMASEMDMTTWLQLCWTFFDCQLDYTLSLYEE